MGLFCLRKESLIALFFLMEKQNLSWVWVDWWAFSDRSELLSSIPTKQSLQFLILAWNAESPRVCKLEALSHSSSVSPTFNLKYLWVFFFFQLSHPCRVLLSYQRIQQKPLDQMSLTLSLVGFFFFLFLKLIYCIIVDLLCYVEFCRTAKWVGYTQICVFLF